ncbi:MAG: glycosyltransferase family 2 protein [Marinobacter sp.]
MNNSKISVGLPVFNGEKYLSIAIESILSQTYADFELIISDNASTDGTESICRAYADTDSRIKYYRNTKNIGLYQNFNRVFDLSNGDYFKWASCDDVCKPDLISRCKDVLDLDPEIVLTYAKATFIDEHGVAVDKRDPGWNLTAEDPIERAKYVISAHHSINSFYGLIRSVELKRTGLFDFYPRADHVLLLKLCLLGKFYEVPAPLYLRRLHLESSMNNIENKSVFLSKNKLSFISKYRGYVRAIVHSSLTTDDKIRILKFTLKRCYWNRAVIFNELRDYLNFYGEKTQ